jgi:hypothetical protein
VAYDAPAQREGLELIDCEERARPLTCIWLHKRLIKAKRDQCVPLDPAAACVPLDPADGGITLGPVAGGVTLGPGGAWVPLEPGEGVGAGLGAVKGGVASPAISD